MTARDRKQLKAFVVLIVVLGVTVYLSVFRADRPSSSAAPPQTPPKDVAAALQQSRASDARIRLDLMKTPAEGEEVGRHNLFQYRQARPAPQPPGPAGTQAQTQAPPVVTPVTPPPAVLTPTTPTRPTTPPVPPMEFKYDGFLKTPNGLAATLSDRTNHYYNLKEDDVVLGRYRIARVTDAVVEVEDLEVPRRQAFARAQQ